MQILLVSKNKITQLWGRAFPFEGIACTVSADVPVNITDYDLIIDLDVEEDPERAAKYAAATIPVCFGSVLYTLEELNLNNSPVARFNHWPFFVERTCIEFYCSETYTQQFQSLFQTLHIPAVKTDDVLGFVSARVIASIINEAYLAAEEDVSTTAEIDIAMKLGTNYPQGPFEWADKIGFQKITQLLQKLSASNSIYLPASQLLTAAS